MAHNSALATIGAISLLMALTVPAHAQSTPNELAKAFENAVIAEDKAAIAKLYTPDAVSYDPGGQVRRGPKEIADSWTDFFDGFEGFTVTLTEHGSRLQGDTNSAWGLWTMSATPVAGGDAVTWNGRYMDVSVKTDDGWRYVADHASMAADPEAPTVSE